MTDQVQAGDVVRDSQDTYSTTTTARNLAAFWKHGLRSHLIRVARGLPVLTNATWAITELELGHI